MKYNFLGMMVLPEDSTCQLSNERSEPWSRKRAAWIHDTSRNVLFDAQIQPVRSLHRLPISRLTRFWLRSNSCDQIDAGRQRSYISIDSYSSQARERRQPNPSPPAKWDRGCVRNTRPQNCGDTTSGQRCQGFF